MTSHSSYPRAVATQETQPFWKHASAGRIVVWKCEDCGRIAPPISPRCPDCLSGNLIEFACSGRATLKGRTVLWVSAFEGQTVPTVLAECALAEEPRVVLIANDPENVTQSMTPGTNINLTFEAGNGGLARVTTEVGQ